MKSSITGLSMEGVHMELLLKFEALVPLSHHNFCLSNNIVPNVFPLFKSPGFINISSAIWQLFY